MLLADRNAGRPIGNDGPLRLVVAGVTHAAQPMPMPTPTPT